VSRSTLGFFTTNGTQTHTQTHTHTHTHTHKPPLVDEGALVTPEHRTSGPGRTSKLSLVQVREAYVE